MKDAVKIKNLFLIMVIINVVIIGVWIFLAIRVKNEGDKLVSVSRELKKESARENALVSLQSSLEDTIAERERLDTYFVFEDEEVSFLEEFEALASLANVDLDVRDFSANENSLNFSFNVVGTFRNMYHFISLIESMPRKVILEQGLLKESVAQRDSQGRVIGTLWEGRFTMRLDSFLDVEQ